jgi:hypothetical protein
VPTTATASDSQEFHASAGEQHNRRIEDLAQQLRIARVAQRNHHGAGLRHLLVLPGRVFKGDAAGDGLGHRAAYAGRFQLRARSAENGLRSTEALQQLGGCAGP